MSDLNLQTNLTANAGSLNAALREGTVGIQSFADAGKKATAEMASGASAEAAAIASKKASVTALNAQRDAMRAATAEANLLKNAHRQLAPQITDIITSIASGQPVWTVAIQQGGQIKDMYGGIGKAAQAMVSLLTPARLAIGGIGAAVAVVAYGYANGQAEMHAYNQALLMTGNVAGTSAAALNSMAARVGAVTGGQAKAAEALAAMAAAGMTVNRTTESMAASAINMERVFGVAISDTVDNFSSLAKAPLEASLKLNSSYHFLTLAVYDQIRALEEQRKTEEAAAIAQKAFGDALDTRTKQMVSQAGLVERAWANAKKVITDVQNGILNIGRPQDPEAELAALRAQREKDKRPLGGGYTSAAVDPRIGQQQRAQDLREQALLEERYMRAGQAAADQVAGTMQQNADAAIKARQENQAWAEAGLSSFEKMTKAQAAYRENNAKIVAGGGTLDPAKVKREEAAIVRQFMGAESEASASAKIANIKSGLKAMTDAYQEAQRGIDAARSASEVSEVEYFQFKRKMIELESQASIKALEAENHVLSLRSPVGAAAIARDSQMAQNRAEAARISAKASSDIAIANAQETASYMALARAQADYWVALQRGQDARERANGRDLGGAAQGDKAREAAKRLAEINDKFSADMDKLSDDRNGGRITGDVYRARMAALEAYHGEALASEQAFQDAKAAVEANADVGMQRAYANYAESARNVAKYSEEAWTRAFSGMEDAMVSFITTGKGGFSALANSIISDLIRIQVRQAMVQASSSGGWLNAFMGALGVGSASGTPGVGTVNGSAGGGFIQANLAHTGGVIGRERLDGSRMVPASMFANAPRYHKGMLASDEFPTILQQGESVLTPGQMRAMGSAGRSSPNITMPLTVINQTGTPAQAQARQKPDGGIELLLTAVKDSMANDIASGVGPVTGALRGRFGLRDKTS